MCGLVGIISPNVLQNVLDKRKLFSSLLYADTLRGPDSTGICLVDKDNTASIYKKALPGYDFVDLRSFESLMRRVDPMIALGHNRKATRGSVTANTAHPFRYGNIILAHNGTLLNHLALEDGNKFQVDSEYIAYAFYKFGVEETLKKIRGAFALTWYDTETKLFNVVRNDERELHYARNKAKNMFMYASEGDMLAWLGNKYSFDLDENTYYEFEPKKWYTLDPETLELSSTDVEFVTPYVHTTKYGNNHTKTGTSTKNLPTTNNNSYRNGKQSLFQQALGRLGMEVEELIYIKFSHITSQGYNVFKLAEWYDVKTGRNVYINDYTLRSEFLFKNKDSTFCATVRGCRNLDNSNDYTLFVNEVKAVEEDTLPEEKKPEREQLMLQGPNHCLVTEKEFLKLTQYGCCQCTAPLSHIDDEDIRWTRQGEPACIDCCMASFLNEDQGLLAGMLEA